jgi:Zn finger protein HypA/HybF involved in hydrogenase expression
MQKRKRTSPIWNIPSNQFQELLDNSNSFVEILIKVGLDPYNGNHKTLNHRIKEEGFDISILEENRKKNQKIHMKSLHQNKTYSLEDVLVENSNFSRKNLKNKILEYNLIQYECCRCKNKGEWLNKILSLQLDHINGINNDNRLENLRFLCPNCHSQTDTYCGKHRKKIYNCLHCNDVINKGHTRCRTCASKINGINQRKFEISEEELRNLVSKYPMTKIGKMFGVSDNAIRKRCKKLGVDF